MSAVFTQGVKERELCRGSLKEGWEVGSLGQNTLMKTAHASPSADGYRLSMEAPSNFIY